MNNEEKQKKSQLIAALREGVAVIQMVFFKELRDLVSNRHPDMDKPSQAMLAGAVTNELFGTLNPERKFELFRNKHHAEIEQLLLGLGDELPLLKKYLTDALRIQTLCDNQEGNDTTETLSAADKRGILIKDRDIPLPSVFITLARGLGEQYQLVIPPSQLTPAPEDDNLIH